MIEGRATARYVRTSAQKAKLVIDLIRGKDVDSALATLRFTRKGVAKDVEKVLRSAVANAQQAQGAGDEVERLYVRECYADQGPTLKRIRAAPMGRAFRILKRTSHLTVIVEERPRRAGCADPAGGGAGRTARVPAAPAAGAESRLPPCGRRRRSPSPRFRIRGYRRRPPSPRWPRPTRPRSRSSPSRSRMRRVRRSRNRTRHRSRRTRSDAPEPGEEPEPDEKSEPDEPDEEPPTLPPGGILGIR